MPLPCSGYRQESRVTTLTWSDLITAATRLRHDLHRQPELAYAELHTAATIRAELDRLGIPWQACADTGTIARLAAQATGPHIALRGDIDALPIRENSTVPWTSTIDGCMHACGHDGHTATLCASAAWLKYHEAQLPGPVSLLFQPAEEGGHGAKRMIEGGALIGITAIYGWHNWPAIPHGQAVCPDGPVMAANGTFRITLRGRGGHASQPEVCRDPVLAAAAVTMALQQIVSRRLAPQIAAVLSVANIDARSSDTVIPEHAVVSGSIRVADTAVRQAMGEEITAIATATAQAYGVAAEVIISPRYAATCNHAGAATIMRTALAAEFGPTWRAHSTPVPVMASEDFSYYLAEIPGAYALVGAAGARPGDPPLHSPHFDFDDRLIARMSRVQLRLAGLPAPFIPAENPEGIPA